MGDFGIIVSEEPSFWIIGEPTMAATSGVSLVSGRLLSMLSSWPFVPPTYNHNRLIIQNESLVKSKKERRKWQMVWEVVGCSIEEMLLA